MGRFDGRLWEIERRLAAIDFNPIERRTSALEQAAWQHWGRSRGVPRVVVFRVHGLSDLLLAGAEVTVEWPGGRAVGATDAAGEASVTIRVPAGGSVLCGITIRKPPRWKEWTASATVGPSTVDVDVYLPTGDPGFDWEDYLASGHHVAAGLFADPTSSNLVFEDPLHGDVALTNTGGAGDHQWFSGAVALDHPGGGGCGAVADAPAEIVWPSVLSVCQVDYRQVGGCPAAGGAVNWDVSSGEAVVEAEDPQSWTVDFAADPWWGGAARTIRIREA